MGTQGCCGSRVCMIMTTRSTLNAHNIHSCTQFGVGKLEVGCKAPSMTQSTPNFQCTEYTIANQFRTFLRKREHQNTPVCPASFFPLQVLGVVNQIVPRPVLNNERPTSATAQDAGTSQPALSKSKLPNSSIRQFVNSVAKD